jgi:hypothetical protein
MVNNPDLAVRVAVDGLSIAYTLEAPAEPFLRSGQLVRVEGAFGLKEDATSDKRSYRRQRGRAPSQFLC